MPYPQKYAEEIEQANNSYVKLLKSIDLVNDPKGAGLSEMLVAGLPAIALAKLPKSLEGLLLKRIKERTGASLRDLNRDLNWAKGKIEHQQYLLSFQYK